MGIITRIVDYLFLPFLGLYGSSLEPPVGDSRNLCLPLLLQSHCYIGFPTFGLLRKEGEIRGEAGDEWVLVPFSLHFPLPFSSLKYACYGLHGKRDGRGKRSGMSRFLLRTGTVM